MFVALGFFTLSGLNANLVPKHSNLAKSYLLLLYDYLFDPIEHSYDGDH